MIKKIKHEIIALYKQGEISPFALSCLMALFPSVENNKRKELKSEKVS